MKGPLATLRPLAALAAAVLVLPVIALLATAPWGDLGSALGSAGVLRALGTSLLTAGLSLVVVTMLGVPLGWVLARDAGWARLRPLVVAWLLVPPVVAGLGGGALLGAEGVAGRLLGLGPGGGVGMVAAQVLVALPWLVLAVDRGVGAIDPRLEQMAALYGLHGWRLLLRVTLPLAGPSIRAGLVLAGARALGEFGAVLAVAGALPGPPRTLPAIVAADLGVAPASALGAALLLLVVAVGLVVVVRGRIGVGA